MSVDIEDIESTKSEKFLAVILLVFLLIGTIWFYVKVEDWVPGGHDFTPSAAERQAQRNQEKAWAVESAASEALRRDRAELSLAKNDFDIAVAKGVGMDEAEADYNAAEADFRSSQRRVAEARARAAEAEKAVQKFDRARMKRSHAGHDWGVAGVRLAFIVGWVLISLRWVSSLRRRQSRFLPLGFAAVGAGVVTAVVYGTDYITDYIDPLDLGPIVLSAVGAAATIGAFVGLQRWLARRIPGRRVRNGECPFCGHPVRGEAPHCEGCGREVIAPCASCSQPRRVGSPHCTACGKA